MLKLLILFSIGLFHGSIVIAQSNVDVPSLSPTPVPSPTPPTAQFNVNVPSIDERNQGDRVYLVHSNQIYQGTVEGIAYEGDFVVQFNDRTIISDSKKLYRTNGCLPRNYELQSFCVNDNVQITSNMLTTVDPLLASTRFVGKILAINANKQTVIVEPSSQSMHDLMAQTIIGTQVYNVRDIKQYPEW